MSKVTDFADLLNGGSLPTDFYNLLLLRWSRLLVQSSLKFHGGYSKYDLGLPAECRQRIRDTFGWTINDKDSTGNLYQMPETVLSIR